MTQPQISRLPANAPPPPALWFWGSQNGVTGLVFIDPQTREVRGWKTATLRQMGFKIDEAEMMRTMPRVQSESEPAPPPIAMGGSEAEIKRAAAEQRARSMVEKKLRGG